MAALVPGSWRCRLALVVALVVMTAGASTLAAQQGQRAPIAIGTFNIRYANANDGDNAWRHRRELVLDVLREGDIWGLQEVLPGQLAEIERALPEFGVLARSRDRDPARGEACPVLFRSARWSLDPTDHGTFWLSTTPDEIGSRSWDAALPRIVTYARLIEKASGRALYVYNAHFDHRGKQARLESARLLAKRVATRRHSDPVVVLGDFNTGPATEPVKALSSAQSGLRDAWRLKQPPRAPERGTFNGWRESFGKTRIDYVFVHEQLEVESCWIDARKPEGRWPSDHAPVRAKLWFADTERVVDVWIGTANSNLSKGIYHCQLDLRTGKLGNSSLAAEIEGPGFLALHPDGRTLYAVAAQAGAPVVVAYAVVPQAGAAPRLRLRNAIAIGDGRAAHVAIDSTGKTLVTAQYGGGSVAVFAVAVDGSIKERTQLHEHAGGSNVVTRRQSKSHPHYVGFSPDERFVFVPDLGADQVAIYRADAARAQLAPHGFASVPAGGGPRHMRFHPDGEWIFVLNELDLSVTVFAYDAAAGGMTRRQTVPTVPKSELQKEQFASCSEICVHPNGEFVYAANRGHDTITAFRFARESGELTLIEREGIRGATPRNFALTPDGRWLLAAGQHSNTLASFAVDSKSGELAYNRSIVAVPSPICVVFGKR